MVAREVLQRRLMERPSGVTVPTLGLCESETTFRSPSCEFVTFRPSTVPIERHPFKDSPTSTCISLNCEEMSSVFSLDTSSGCLKDSASKACENLPFGPTVVSWPQGRTHGRCLRGFHTWRSLLLRLGFLISSSKRGLHGAVTARNVQRLRLLPQTYDLDEEPHSPTSLVYGGQICCFGRRACIRAGVRTLHPISDSLLREPLTER